MVKKIFVLITIVLASFWVTTSFSFSSAFCSKNNIIFSQWSCCSGSGGGIRWWNEHGERESLCRRGSQHTNICLVSDLVYNPQHWPHFSIPPVQSCAINKGKFIAK